MLGSHRQVAGMGGWEWRAYIGGLGGLEWRAVAGWRISAGKHSWTDDEVNSPGRRIQVLRQCSISFFNTVVRLIFRHYLIISN